MFLFSGKIAPNNDNFMYYYCFPMKTLKYRFFLGVFTSFYNGLLDPKNSKKSLIHENAGANITCDFGDGDISRSRSFLSNTCDTYIHTYTHTSLARL